MLREVVFLELENSPFYNMQMLSWQQNGTTPHFGVEVLEYLNSKCNEWIGRRGTIKWPASLPDLTPCDFLLWGIVKELVYSSKLQNLHKLKSTFKLHLTKLMKISLCC